MTQSTIVAPATPRGIGGIAVVRLSGPQSKNVLYKLINNNSLNRRILHKKAAVFNLFDENNNQIDETVCTFFKSPGSFTGEDVVEISCHGNPLIVDRIVSACIGYGAQIAEPGEFTRRAFVNGKMDLIQAEAIASLIHSKSEESNMLNLKLLSGSLSKKFKDIQNQIINAASLIELELDISEEELQPRLAEQISGILHGVKKEFSELLNSYKQARLLNNGALVVIAGKPNVGKSTLLNALTESDRAITSSQPGTTRDAIDVPLLLDGVPVNLVDTAGIRDTSEEIESEGVRRSFTYIEKADLIVFLNDVSEPDSYNLSLPNDIPIINVFNKIDLLTDKELKYLDPIEKNMLILSAKTGYGLSELKTRIKDILGISSSLADTLSITTSRQHAALTGSKKNIDATLSLLDENPLSYELISIELGEALENIGSILGKTTPDDILNNIFNQFCVGK